MNDKPLPPKAVNTVSVIVVTFVILSFAVSLYAAWKARAHRKMVKQQLEDVEMIHPALDF